MVEGIATELLIIPSGIPFNIESLTEYPKKYVNTIAKAAVKIANRKNAEEIDLTIRTFFLF
jgi:hypothetical protein